MFLICESTALCKLFSSRSPLAVWADTLRAFTIARVCFYFRRVASDRVKRNEKLIPSGCLVHFSSVAAAALATSLRALLLF